MADDIDDLVNGAFELPAAPLVAQRVMAVTADDTSSAADLVKIIGTDAGFNARILKVANSSFYGAANTISTLQTAIVVLGFNTIRNLVISASSKDIYRDFGEHEKRLWEHSVGTAIAGLVLARRTHTALPDEAFTAGLFHDIGRGVLINQCREKYLEHADELSAGGDDVVELEAEVFGFDHTAVGSVLLNTWNFPRSLAAAVRLHHNARHFDMLEGPVKTIVAITSMANTICHAIGIGVTGGKPISKSSLKAATHLALSADDIQSIGAEVKDVFEREANLFL